jgi:hypothetical protein
LPELNGTWLLILKSTLATWFGVLARCDLQRQSNRKRKVELDVFSAHHERIRNPEEEAEAG